MVLTDILGLEDALGTMDFKVAGNDKGELATCMYSCYRCSSVLVRVLRKVVLPLSLMLLLFLLMVLHVLSRAVSIASKNVHPTPLSCT